MFSGCFEEFLLPRNWFANMQFCRFIRSFGCSGLFLKQFELAEPSEMGTEVRNSDVSKSPIATHFGCSFHVFS